MSTLKVTNINSNTASTPPVINDSAGTQIGTFCRAWANFNGTTASPSTIRADFNVSSITKNTTGDYTVNFTTAMPDANYSVVACAGDTSGNTSPMVMLGNNTSIPAFNTSSIKVFSRASTTNTMQDQSIINIAIFR